MILAQFVHKIFEAKTNYISENLTLFVKSWKISKIQIFSHFRMYFFYNLITWLHKFYRKVYFNNIWILILIQMLEYCKKIIKFYKHSNVCQKRELLLLGKANKFMFTFLSVYAFASELYFLIILWSILIIQVWSFRLKTKQKSPLFFTGVSEQNYSIQKILS